MYHPPFGPFSQGRQHLSLSSHQGTPHQWGTVSGRFVPRKNFPTDKKVILGWGGASRNPRVGER